MSSPVDQPIRQSGGEPAWLRTLVALLRRAARSARLSLVLAICAAISGIATYIAWTNASPFGGDPGLVLALLVADLVLLLCLGGMVASQLVGVWAEHRRGSAGSRLHVRLVALFALVAAVPTIIVAVFSAVFFYLGIQSWFSERVRTAVQESVAVAEAYVAEHRDTIRADLLAMANDLNRAAPQIARNQAVFNKVLTTQAALRSLAEATVFDSGGRILARTTISLAATFNSVPLSAVDRATDGQVVVFADDADDQVQALVRLDGFLDAYLYVGRFVEPRVISHVQRTRDVVAEYDALEGARTKLQVMSALIFLVVALMLLLIAVWIGMWFANRLVRPIRALMMAAEAVRQGDLNARIHEGEDDDELERLGRAFNRMTRQLQAQRGELVDANRKLDRRRRFTEAVLAGVTAGVIGIDQNGRIDWPNESAANLLNTSVDNLLGRPLPEVLPEFAPLVEQVRRRPERLIERQIEVNRDGRRRTYLVRVNADRARAGARRFVITFDDISELLQAQRTAAWADVARRIAHEIKNPLTPIQLAAERIRRKYRGQIDKDAEIFEQCTDTIIRHVGDIGQMIDEFSAFARMPAPVPKPVNLTQLARDAVFALDVAHPWLKLHGDFPDRPVVLDCDARQIRQCLTNLIQNAAESIEAAIEEDGLLSREEAEIRLCLRIDEDRVFIDVSDNGRGLPRSDRERLTEPYVTTRARGNGLGLAIVDKIMEDHDGRLHLADRPDGRGALVSIELPVHANPVRESDVEAPALAEARHGA